MSIRDVYRAMRNPITPKVIDERDRLWWESLWCDSWGCRCSWPGGEHKPRPGAKELTPCTVSVSSEP